MKPIPINPRPDNVTIKFDVPGTPKILSAVLHMMDIIGQQVANQAGEDVGVKTIAALRDNPDRVGPSGMKAKDWESYLVALSDIYRHIGDLCQHAWVGEKGPDHPLSVLSKAVEEANGKMSDAEFVERLRKTIEDMDIDLDPSTITVDTLGDFLADVQKSAHNCLSSHLS